MKTIKSIGLLFTITLGFLVGLSQSGLAQPCLLDLSPPNDTATMIISMPWGIGFPNNDISAQHNPAYISNYVAVGNAIIPSGYYRGWCIDVQDDLGFNPTTYMADLFSTCDPNLNQKIQALDTDNDFPASIYVGPDVWKKINYILNHKNGAYFWNVQMAIWNLIGGPIDPTFFSSPYPPTDANAVNQLLSDANANAANWIPACGDVIAVVAAVADDSLDVQLTIIEVPYPCCTGQIGDFVWNDVNGNGCQDAGEPGIPGVKVDLYSGCGANKGTTPIATTTTDANGLYLFTGLCAGDYTVSFTTPNGFVHTVANQGCGGKPGDAHNPNDSNCQCTGADNCDVCVTLATDNTQDLTIDCGYIGSTPCLNFTKTADSNSAPAGGQMGYTYALNNCGGTTYSNLAIVDDAGTPGFPGDDFTVGSGITLFPGHGTNIHVVVNLPIIECVSNSNPGITAGLLITQVLPNGNIKVDFRQSRNLNDNVYGAPAPADGWAHHNFSDLTGSDKAEFKFVDGNSKVVLDFYSDYISAASSSVTPLGTILYPSGYGSLGPNGGDGLMILGSKSNVLWWSSTLTSNLNSGLNGGFPSPYLLNSPTPESSFPNWDYVDGFSVIVSSNAFGAAGFGGVTIPFVHNSPAKTGDNKVSPVPCAGCVTNIASVVTVDGANGILATIATDDAVVCLDNPAPPPSTCLITKGAFKIDKNTIQIPLKNAGSANILLTEVGLGWNQVANGKLIKVSLNGDFWTGSTGSPVALTSGFNADANRRTIAKGQTKTLVLTFEHPASKVISDYTGGTVKFGTCVVNFP